MSLFIIGRLNWINAKNIRKVFSVMRQVDMKQLTENRLIRLSEAISMEEFSKIVSDQIPVVVPLRKEKRVSKRKVAKLRDDFAPGPSSALQKVSVLNTTTVRTF